MVYSLWFAVFYPIVLRLIYAFYKPICVYKTQYAVGRYMRLFLAILVQALGLRWPPLVNTGWCKTCFEGIALMIGVVGAASIFK